MSPDSFDEDSNYLYVDDFDIPTIDEKIPASGAYVLVAHYYQPERPSMNFDIFKKNPY